MRATVALWSMLRTRSSRSRDPQRLTELLAVIAFATTTAVLLIVIGGFQAFWDRAGGADGIRAGLETAETPYDVQYPFLAGIAVLLILVPLGTLGAAAARMAAARRDARLAALRLCGATRSQVAGLTVMDAVAQAAVGALAGTIGYALLVPVVAQVRFQGRTFALSELVVGVPVVLGSLVAVVLIAVLSAFASLRRVAITPLGVANRVTPPAMRAVRLLSTVAAAAALIVGPQLAGGSAGLALGVLVALLLITFATMNVVGPFVLWVVGRITAAVARSVPTLLAGRRIADAPKSAWRSVGGVALATFIAGLTATFSLLDPAGGVRPDEAAFIADLKTGGFLTLAIAGLLAAVSTGVMQAGRVIEQREEHRALVLAGTDRRTLDRARMRETVVPLTASVGVATVTVLMVMVPVVGLQPVSDPGVVVQYLLCVAAASGLVLAGAAAAGRVARVG
ncbi:FtsX-like permease family protein [Mumia zhuanghuii]|uniref:FtsX-like permease family protein n=2 Tax=Mumia TaxID=1546255 RepID=A0ABW1QHG7_9ACTN|nr:MULTISPECIES: FtsX-like permease family protein [Mumia]KAA1424734.1 FtsX-like permease family protein [Mumia zhuanghuii]